MKEEGTGVVRRRSLYERIKPSKAAGLTLHRNGSPGSFLGANDGPYS